MSCVTVMNKNGFQTKVWGPPIWFFLHIISQNYNPEKPFMRKGYFNFFKNLQYVLPCGACRDNYSKIISKGPLKLTYDVFNTRETLSYWTFALHNKVQEDIYMKTKKKYNKPKYQTTKKDFETTYKFYEKFRAKCTSDNSSYGCTVPMFGIKKRVKINVCPLGKNFRAHRSIRLIKC